MPQKIVTPEFRAKAFTCIHPDCATVTSMQWSICRGNFNGYPEELPIWICRCDHCKNLSIWGANGEGNRGFLIYPGSLPSPLGHEYLPEDCKGDFEEARLICSASPRGAAAILRLCLQKLLSHIGGKGEHIDADIKALVASGLDPHIQQALDVIRVTGNNAVHPLEMNLEDDQDSVLVLFEMINLIVEERIARPARINERFANLPEKARLAIEKRDKPKQ